MSSENAPRFCTDAEGVVYAVWLDPLHGLPWAVLTFVNVADPSQQIVRRVRHETDLADLTDRDLLEFLNPRSGQSGPRPRNRD